MRSALVTAIGDPVTIPLFFDLFKTRWADEVDELLLYVNHAYIEPRFLEFISDLVSGHPKVKFKYINKGGYGGAQTELTQDAQGDYLLYMEEDCWIDKPGAIDKWFKKLEDGTYDIADSPRTAINMDVHKREEEVFGLLKNRFDEGCNFWPNLFFARKDLMMKTDLDFMSKDWKQGQYIKELDYNILEDGTGADTQSWISIQLRAMTNKIGLVPQYKAYPHIDDQLFASKDWTFSPEAGRVHAGSLSSALYNYLRLENGVPIGFKNKPDAQPMPTYAPIAHDIERQDYHLRVAMWTICMEYAWDQLKGMDDFRQDYQNGILKIAKDLDLDWDDINRRVGIYKTLIDI